MVGILIISHGAFGEALLRCAGHVLGERPAQAGYVAVAVCDDPDAILLQARRLARELDHGDGVLVLTDILGATPSNIASRLLAPGRIEGVSGASLPMLIRALTYRNEPLATVVGKAVSAAHECTVRITSESGDAADRG